TRFLPALFLLLSAPLAAQNETDRCHDFDCMMGRAHGYLDAGRYLDAFNAATAAKHYSVARDVEADAFLAIVVKKIDLLRIDAVRAK
ncbi:hypothetical protein M3M33_15125, partial [Loigolactobacillus coryniformis]|uniref:hypothetical protein n=1 Tax=Loigolactobacillus coryniformis TaxID=1610 RepID=UPI00201A6444